MNLHTRPLTVLGKCFSLQKKSKANMQNVLKKAIFAFVFCEFYVVVLGCFFFRGIKYSKKEKGCRVLKLSLQQTGVCLDLCTEPAFPRAPVLLPGLARHVGLFVFSRTMSDMDDELTLKNNKGPPVVPSVSQRRRHKLTLSPVLVQRTLLSLLLSLCLCFASFS